MASRGPELPFSPGFTLLEVLVATAIVGIALGVALAAIAHGRGEMWRGRQAREAAGLLRWAAYSMAVGRGVEAEQSPKGHPGWRVLVHEPREVQVEVTDSNSTPIPLGRPQLQEEVVEAVSPQGHHYFLRWVERRKGS